MGAYASALRRAVRPGAIVVDIGTGTGIMACLACQYGARRVYAIEPADAIEVARDIARANGFGERIQFIQKPSMSVTLPEQADVIVSDLRGVLPLLQHHVPSIVDARARLLKRGGALIPQRDVIRVCVASAPDLYESRVTPWERNELGLDMSPASRIETNAWQKCRAGEQHILLEPQDLATLDYGALESSDVRRDLLWIAARGGEAHGLIVWFDADLDGQAGFTNAPGAPEVIYGQGFFPWTRPVSLVAGDTISVSMQSILVGDDYVWTWATRISAPGGTVKADFYQSSFFGVPLSRATLARRAADHVALLAEDGRLDHLILTLLDERLPLGRIADEVLAKFPRRVRTWEHALARVADLSVRYGEAP